MVFVFLTSVLFVTDLLTVSTLAAEVSVARFVVSIFIVLSVVLFEEDEESTTAESAALPDLFPLHAATDNDTTRAKRDNLIAFFMELIVKILTFNNFKEVKF